MPPRPANSRWRLAIWAALVALAAGAACAFFLLRREPPVPAPAPEPPAAAATSTRETIGYSVEGRAIEAYTYGSGATKLLFVGGIHGGYEWNSVALAYRAMDHLAANPGAIPDGVAVVVVPNANPDAVFDVAGKEGRIGPADLLPGVDEAAARFNANGVDLNRNFGCKWQPEATWRGNKVSAGTAAFSEPEARAVRDLALELRPAVAVFWHSQANAVYASECEAGILPETLAAMAAYAGAAGYAAVDSFDAYPVTGDVEGWLASVGIPAITVELSSHESLDWEKNLAGLAALLARYGAR
jgi:predicted deacylase